jgi:hypothetical protein
MFILCLIPRLSAATASVRPDPANEKDKLPGRLQRRCVSKSRDAGPVNFIDWILIMASMGWAGACLKGVEIKASLVSAWDCQEGCAFQPRCGLKPLTQPKESMMRLYDQPHPFYAGIDLHARTM